MAELTELQIEHIRAQSGDDCEPYDVSDAYMQWLHDEYGSVAPLCMSGDALGKTIVMVLQTRVRKAMRLFNEDGDGGTRNVSTQYTQLKEQLEAAEAKCGMAGGLITIGSFDMDLDSECESEYAPSVYGYPWSWGHLGQYW